MVSRRAFLGAAGVLAATASGCSGVLGLGPTVRVAVSWSGGELQAFRSVLDALGIRDYDYQLIPLGDDISTAFGPRAAQRPDVVMLPQPGLVGRYLEDLEPLPEGTIPDTSPYGEVWDGLLRPGNSPWYGLPFKIAHKSTVWYRKSVFEANDLTPPTLWSDWLELNKILSSRRIAPLALAGADGWMLTDFFENVLLGCAPDAYEKLALAGAEPKLSDESAVAAVEQALRLLGRMWAAPGTLAGGVTSSLVQQFSDAVVEVFGYRRAAMVVAPDFAEPVVRRFAADPGDIGVFTFPAVDGDSVDPAPGSAPPVVVGGDVAVLTTPAGEQARDLVQRLAGQRAALPWIGRGGFLAADERVLVDQYSAELEPLARQLAGDTASIRFDLSDQLGPLGGSERLWRVLQDFLFQVGGSGENVVSHAREAVRRLREFEG